MLALIASFALADVTVGAAAPAFTLKDVDGTDVSLADYTGKVVVLEWFNPNCPFVIRHTKDKTMPTTAAKHADVVWLSINSTAKGRDEYMGPEQMKKWAADNGITSTLLVDGDGAVGKRYGAKTTPHMFVIDKAGNIAYAGAIDDDPAGRSDVGKRKNYVDQALTALKAGKKVSEPTTKSYGCGVKYSS